MPEVRIPNVMRRVGGIRWHDDFNLRSGIKLPKQRNYLSTTRTGCRFKGIRKAETGDFPYSLHNQDTPKKSDHKKGVIITCSATFIHPAARHRIMPGI